MQEEHVLSVAARRQIYECVRANPGAHLRDIARRCDTPLGTTHYHLDYLDSNGFITSRRDGRYKRYFSTDGMGRRERELLTLLRHNVPRRISYVLLERRTATQRELCAAIGVSRSTLSFHLNRLVREQAVLRHPTRPENRYELTEPSLIHSLLARFEKSLSPKDAEQYGGTRSVPVEETPRPTPVENEADRRVASIFG